MCAVLQIYVRFAGTDPCEIYPSQFMCKKKNPSTSSNHCCGTKTGEKKRSTGDGGGADRFLNPLNTHYKKKRKKKRCL